DRRNIGTSGSDIYGTRIDTAGNVLNPGGVLISSFLADQKNPVVAFDGTNYWIVWDDNRNSNLDIYATRMNPTGSIVDEAFFTVSIANSAEQTPAMVCNGSSYCLVAYKKSITTPVKDRIFARVVTGTPCAYFAAGVVCREAAHSCDIEEECDGTSVVCPTDELEQDGHICYNDGLACNVEHTCQSGVCLESAPPDCDDGNPCTNNTCVEPTGCSNPHVANGTPCPEGVCMSGQCLTPPDGGFPDGSVDIGIDAMDANDAIDAGTDTEGDIESNLDVASETGPLQDAAKDSVTKEASATDMDSDGNNADVSGDIGPPPSGCECSLDGRNNSGTADFWIFGLFVLLLYLRPKNRSIK
ncbi:MAG: hypothetical protein V1754_14740, partial [Pseudomonadota bacterium]